MTAIPTMPKSEGANKRATTRKTAQVTIWLLQSAAARQARLCANDLSSPVLEAGTVGAGSALAGDPDVMRLVDSKRSFSADCSLECGSLLPLIQAGLLAEPYGAPPSAVDWPRASVRIESGSKLPHSVKPPKLPQPKGSAP